MADSVKGYEYLARMFREYGVTHLFYQELMFAKTLKHAEELGIKPVLAHSEFAAGYMADGYARVSGRPGVCMAQSIGSANLAASVHDAWLGTTPVIAMTGRKTDAFQHRNAYQESDHAFFRPLVKFDADVGDPSQLPHLVRQSWRMAASGKPRPVHLDILGFFGLELELADIEEPFAIEPDCVSYPPYRPAADPAMVERAAAAIAAAERPVLVIGRGALVSGAGEALLELMRRADIPFVTTPDGKSVLDESCPRWCGIVGGYGMDCANKTVAAADLVVFVGTQTGDQTTLNWTVPGHSVKAVQIDIDPAELGRNYPDCIGLCGDARTVTEQLAAAVSAKENPAWRTQTGELVAATVAEQQAMWSSAAAPINTGRLCAEVSAALPDNGILVADTGWSAVWSACMIRMKQSQMYTRAAGSLGWSFPASLGAKCGAPERPVVNFIGDGGFFYFSNEMETAMRCNIPTVTVLNNNMALAQVIPFMKGSYAKDEMGRIVDRLSFKGLRFTGIAKEFGLNAVCVERAEEIGPAITAAIESGRPSLVEVITDTACEPLPAWK